MISAAYPEDEQRRLELLSRSGLLDGAQDAFLDPLTKTVARSFRVPMVAVTLIDRDRQVIRASFGLGVASTPRACSFCAHMLWWPEPLVVADARSDNRFTGNPLVDGEPHIRFYAGVPLHLRGVPVGALCLLDRRPNRTFESRDLHILRGAAMAVEERLIQLMVC